jgi:ABC-type multidrug transport system ATPase subunit
MSVIEVEHLRKRYRDVVAVDDVSFTVERGEIFGILGPNGAGKTTMVEIIEGLRTPDDGTIRWDWTRTGTASSCASVSGPSCRRASCPTS